MRTHPFLKRSRPYFKLIGGANFTDYAELQELVELYTKAGADLIDAAATPEAVMAARRGIAAARRDEPDPLLMISVTAADDPHCRLAVQDADRCTKVCPHCRNACPHGAISAGLDILEARCVGCNLCVPACPYEAITLEARPFNPSLDQLWQLGARGLELHTGGGDLRALGAWRESCISWVERGGMFSASLNAAQLSLREAIALARELCAWFPEDLIILQADGKPISGHGERESTRAALDFAQALLEAELPAIIQPAGGANQFTGPLAKLRGMAIGGIGIGSYARCIIALETDSHDPSSYEDPMGPEARLERARRLVATVHEGEEVASWLNNVK